MQKYNPLLAPEPLKTGDYVHARDEFGPGGQFYGVLVNLNQQYSLAAENMGVPGGRVTIKADVLDTSVPGFPMLKKAVMVFKDESKSSESGMEEIKNAGLVKLASGRYGNPQYDL